MKTLPFLAVTGLAVLPRLSAAEPAWHPLFNSTDLNGWTVTLEGQKPGEDPDKLVQVHDGAIHLYRDTPEGRKSPFGMISHEKTYSRFQFRFEYRWGTKRFAPRADKVRDAGMLFHIRDISKIWPASVECQVQEGDTGDLIYINTGGHTWMQPGKAGDKNGSGPGLLPEQGGVLRLFKPSWPYIGDLEVADTLTGWNKVEITVHAADAAEFAVNGRTITRLGGFLGQDGTPLTEGKIGLQLEGAELEYRAIEIRELDPPVAPDRRVVSFSSVKGQLTRTQVLRATNPGTTDVSGVSIVGADAKAFEVLSGPVTLAAGASGEWTIAFHPENGARRYSAGLRIGDAAEGAFVVLQGLALDKFEGENEPPLQDIVHALGIPLDVGGSKLTLDKDAPTIGDGVAAAYFTATGGRLRVTPLARFSPKGEVPFGLITPGNEDLQELGKLADVSGSVPDTHQCLLPPLSDGKGSLEIDAPAGSFGFFMKGHQYVSFTDPKRPTTAKIAHTARIYPVRHFQGRAMENAWLIGFEEAANGDYQDAVILVEGMKPAE